ncbi:hypothetical protein EI94DRAFT_887381 [Lactarius quietus]|nr:hypothetical protein EI94DRAFT_887381 [Lactarius quietus]
MTDIQVDPSISQLNISDGRFDRVIVSRIHNLLQMCLSATSPLTDEVRKSCLRMCLKSLWHCAKEYNQLNASKPLPSYFLVVLAAPEITHRIQTEQDPVSHVIGRCFVSLVISKLVVSFRSRTDPTAQIGDEELACLAAILDAESQDVKIWLRLPGTVALANIASLAFNKVNTVIYGMGLLDTSIRDTVQQTLGILSQSLSAELSADLRPDQTNTSPSTLSYGQFEQVALSRLYGLFETCTRQMPRLTEEIRTSCLRMCLKSLWDYGRTYHRPGASELLPSYIPLTLGGPQMISRIHSEQNHAVRMMGRCFEALIANNLAAHVKSHADSNPLISGEALECLSTILSTGKADVVLWLSWPGAVELANMVSLIFSEIHFYSDAAQSDVLDTVQQTFNILTQTLPDEFNAELWPDDMDTLTDVTDGTSPLTEPIHKSHSRMCLKNLWHCARTYNQLSISVPLPSFVRITLASPEFTRRIHAERDLTARVTGRCAYALVVNKLVDDLQSRTSLRNGVYDAELASISSIIGTDPSELLLWPRPSTAIKLQNVVFLMSGEIEALFSSSETASVDVLHIVRQTLNVICSDLVLGGAFAGGDLPTDQVLLLRSIYSRIANARAVNRFNDHTVEILDRLQQITNQLSTVEHKMRRCTSTLFDANSVRGRGNVATQPECEVGRRRSRSM